MRQFFDVGDLVDISLSPGGRGIILETSPINKSVRYTQDATWHTDEYKCKIQFRTKTGETTTRWIRAKWLKHLSKINE